MLCIIEYEIPLLDEKMSTLPEDIYAKKVSIVDLLTISGIFESKSAARRMLRQKGIQMVRKSGEWVKMLEYDNFIIFDNENTLKVLKHVPEMKQYNNWLC